MLIDGNGMLFDNDSMNGGERGGRKAAITLHHAVSEWAVRNVTECPRNVKIIVRVYANLRGLMEVCDKAGIVDSPGKVEDFARGFNSSMALCDFLDAPNGNSAEAKITGKFQIRRAVFCREETLTGPQKPSSSIFTTTTVDK